MGKPEKTSSDATLVPEAASLYERDFYTWTQEQGRILRERRASDVDWEHAAEEIESVGGSEKNEIRSRMVRLLQHLLKWEHQPRKRCQSWLSSISEQRIHIDGLIEASPSLGRHPAEVMAWSYARAAREAARETRLPPGIFPASPPYTADEALDPDFMPGPPWSPEDIIGD